MIKHLKRRSPHAKQDRLVEELVERMWNGKKSLVFVRRIASAYELEDRIGECFAGKMYKRLENISKGKRFESDALKRLCEKYKERNKQDKIKKILDRLAERLNHYNSKNETFVFLTNQWNTDNEFVNYLRALLTEIYQDDDPIFDKLRQLTLSHLDLKKIKVDYRIEALSCLLKTIQKSANNNFSEDEEYYLVEDTSPYFFTDFFRTDLLGKRFRKRMNNRSWFELNIFLINQAHNLFCLDWQKLSVESSQEEKLDLPEKKRFENGQKKIRNAIITDDYVKTHEASSAANTELKRSTFLTELLLNECAVDFETWIKSLKKRQEFSPDMSEKAGIFE